MGGILRLPSPQESGPSQDEARPTWNRSSTCIRGEKPGLTELLTPQHRPRDPTTPLPVVAQPWRKPTCSVLRRPGVPPHQVLFKIESYSETVLSNVNLKYTGLRVGGLDSRPNSAPNSLSKPRPLQAPEPPSGQLDISDMGGISCGGGQASPGHVCDSFAVPHSHHPFFATDLQNKRIKRSDRQSTS